MDWRVTVAALLVAACGGQVAPDGGDDAPEATTCTQDAECPVSYRCGASNVCEPLPPDTTAPLILSKSPDCHPGCWVGETLTIQMNEPVRMGAGAVTASFTQAEAPFTARLSEDQRTIEVSFTGLTAPNEVTLRLSGVTDLSGNAYGNLPIAYGYPAWSPRFGPQVTTAGASSGVLSAVQLPTGEPVVAWAQDEGYANAPLYVSKLKHSGGWERLATLNVDPAKPAAWPFIAARGETMVAAWIENRAVRAATVSAAGRELLGTTVNTAGLIDDPPAVTLDAEGRPVVAWEEGTSILAARWSGTAWETLGTSVSDAGDQPGPVSLALAPDGRPCAVYVNYGATAAALRLRCFAEGTWTSIANEHSVARSVVLGRRALAFDAAGSAYLSWQDNWVQQIAEVSNAAWQITALAEEPNRDPPSVAVDSTLGPVVSFCGNRVMGLVRRTQTGWEQVPQYSIGWSQFDIGSCDVVTGATGPWIAWNAVSSDSHMRLLRYNR